MGALTPDPQKDVDCAWNPEMTFPDEELRYEANGVHYNFKVTFTLGNGFLGKEIVIKGEDATEKVDTSMTVTLDAQQDDEIWNRSLANGVKSGERKPQYATLHFLGVNQHGNFISTDLVEMGIEWAKRHLQALGVKVLSGRAIPDSIGQVLLTTHDFVVNEKVTPNSEGKLRYEYDLSAQPRVEAVSEFEEQLKAAGWISE